jgi:hypothetical protein
MASMIAFPSVMMTYVKHSWVDVDNGIERFTLPRRPPTCGQKRACYVLHQWMARSARYMGGRYGARHLLPFDFGEPTGDMGMLWLDLAGLVKGGARFVNLPLHQARVPVYKGLVRQARRGHALR